MRQSILVLILAFAAPLAGAETTVKEFEGSKSITTPLFTVEAPWVIDWRLDADYEQLVALDVTLLEGRTGRHVGRVLHTKYKGNGVKMFDQSGTFQLRISATLARYRLRIIQLTEEEAALYTPKGQ